MSSSYEEQRKEIEQILKRIFYKYNLLSKTLYYKEGGKELDFISTTDYLRISDIIFGRQLEYALYVYNRDNIAPSMECLLHYDEAGRATAVALAQFIDKYFIPSVGLFTEYKDPLDQLLGYRRFLVGHFPNHAYYCSDVYVVVPYNPDPTSIFPGKRGIVAYCTTFENAFRILMSKQTEKVLKDLFDVWRRALDKAGNNPEILELWHQDKIKACELSHIEKAAHDEIEEAERIMRKYGIIRVAFPLD